MKIPLRLFVASAAFLLVNIASHCFAVSQVSIDLTGQKLKTGHNILVTSTAAIDHAAVYYYAVSGTVVATSGTNEGTGQLLFITGTGGTSLDAALSLTARSLLPYLNGTVVDASQNFPFTALNKLSVGSQQIGAHTDLVGTVQVKVGITHAGIAFGKVSDVLFGIKVPVLGTIPDETDSLEFTSGQIVVQTSPFGGPAQPDLSITGTTGSLIGVGVTGTDGTGETFTESHLLKRGLSYTRPVVLQNIGNTADTYVLTAPALGAGFTQKIIIGGKNETAAITGTAGYTTPSLAPGAVKTFTWTIADKSAAAESGTTGFITATSVSGTTQDTIGFSVLTK